jgi:polysaccharide export outer membrane protein
MNARTVRRPRSVAAARSSRLACLFLAAGAAGACTSYPKEPFTPGELVGAVPKAPPSELPGGEPGAPDASAIPRYTVLPGDGLDVLYNLEYKLSEKDYELDILDRIHITVLSHDEVNGDYQVRPDGKITLPYAGSVVANGLTLDQLIEKLRTAFSGRFENPEIFINLTQFGARIDELKKMISSDRRGQIFEATVRPDGYITLPIVGDIYASGKSSAELNDLVNSSYQPHYRNIQVSTIIRDTASNVCFVLGEVALPGQIAFTRSLTLTQALAKAGVQTSTAGLETVVVINMGQEKPAGRVYNVAALFSGKGGQDAILTRDDVVFVPKSPIAEADLWVSQYIEQLLLYRGSSFSYSISHRIN